jgi:hypothetical protein
MVAMGQRPFPRISSRVSGLVGAYLLMAWALTLVVFPGAGAAGEDPSFVAGVADLPLMPGLAEVPEAGVVFDKPAGRIVEAYAQGPLSRAAVTRFYLSTLPNLGWRAKAEAPFRREGEELHLGFMGDDGALVVRFTLQPE